MIILIGIPNNQPQETRAAIASIAVIIVSTLDLPPSVLEDPEFCCVPVAVGLSTQSVDGGVIWGMLPPCEATLDVTAAESELFAPAVAEDSRFSLARLRLL